MEDKNICMGHWVDNQTLEDLKHQLEDEDNIYDLSSMFKALSDPTRLNIISLLAKQELCVCDIATILGSSQSSISHHLRTLRNTRLVRFRKEGKQVIYSVDDDHVFELFSQGLNHIKHK